MRNNDCVMYERICVYEVSFALSICLVLARDVILWLSLLLHNFVLGVLCCLNILCKITRSKIQWPQSVSIVTQKSAHQTASAHSFHMVLMSGTDWQRNLSHERIEADILTFSAMCVLFARLAFQLFVLRKHNSTPHAYSNDKHRRSHRKKK